MVNSYAKFGTAIFNPFLEKSGHKQCNKTKNLFLFSVVGAEVEEGVGGGGGGVGCVWGGGGGGGGVCVSCDLHKNQT